MEVNSTLSEISPLIPWLVWIVPVVGALLIPLLSRVNSSVRDYAPSFFALVSALLATLAASLTAMVANLTFGKKKWLPLYDQMCLLSLRSQAIKDEMLCLIDADADAFNRVMDSYRLPKGNDNQILIRKDKIENAMKEH